MIKRLFLRTATFSGKEFFDQQTHKMANQIYFRVQTKRGHLENTKIAKLMEKF